MHKKGLTFPVFSAFSGAEKPPGISLLREKVPRFVRNSSGKAGNSHIELKVTVFSV